MTDAEIRDIFLAHGFVIKEGLTDLKPYVYEAARALLEAERKRVNFRKRLIDSLGLRPERFHVSISRDPQEEPKTR